MDAAAMATFWGVSMLFVLTPGVDWAYAISSGLRRGGVTPAVSGMLVGHLVATAVVSAGAAAVLGRSESAMTVLTLAGSAYLVWLGVSALRDPAGPDLDWVGPPLQRRRLLAKGIGISLLNPKVFLLFLALLPQFATPTAAAPLGVQMMLLGVVHVANCAVVYIAVGFGAGRILTRRPGAAKVVGRISGVVMIALGVVLAAERVLELAR
jgi:threonine/homoserine/homoserine lactone efflux protein